ncbi:TetR/AcrR family transcriptional regulator [Neobacillus sp. MM2021_6]|uniref:TetR/AcrR family transcriptional regulator n=1 Tax=Bacillaceae TaxID=186817 RepID=UPI001407825E|nr:MULTISPECIES: TetR/AcrR family transcriptional regulator [Bacillaceae]MBO0960899.1 TetR/AcrR family transcriptional regulator [Neobacillus sp. MM2021_6]NHC21482.1 TetR/AcrR family transcriptional regulator [Bacillus sp. MM2020_4]
MASQKTDPRVIRTRQLLQDSFTSLIREKDFNSITIGDIANRATVNRATFYAHFTDKYELLDSTITSEFRDNLKQRINCQSIFTQEIVSNILFVMCDYHKNLSTVCSSRYESLGSVIQNNVIEELGNLIYHLLVNMHKQNSGMENQESIKTISTMISWSIYGASYSWNRGGRKITSEEFVNNMMPIIMNGVSSIL